MGQDNRGARKEMKKIVYYLSENTVPNDEELQKCLDIQAANPDEEIVLKWYIPAPDYFLQSYWYELWFGVNNLKTIKDCRENMPEYYPV